MKKILIAVLLSSFLLTGCASIKEINAGDTSSGDKNTIQDNNTIDNTEDETNKKIILEVKEYIQNGQNEKSEAVKIKWSKTFLDNADIEALYKDFIKSADKKDDVEAFAKFITENAPISGNWEEMFKKDVYEIYKEDIVNIKHLEGDLYEGYIVSSGKEIPYVVVSSRTGYFHGTSGTTGTSENVKANLMKEEYIEKLNKLKSDLESSSDQRYAGTTTLEMVEAGNEEYKLWDDILNEIYSALKDQLSKEEMDKLIDEEVNWIKIRDDKVVLDSAKYEGGSIKPLIEIKGLIESTKDRSYELVDKYMK